MLRLDRAGGAGHNVVHDLDNRVKTIFDALRKAKGDHELGLNTKSGLVTPGSDEKPFYVLLENDNLITHASVATDTLLAPVENTTPDEAARLVVTVTIRPYNTHLGALNYV